MNDLELYHSAFDMGKNTHDFTLVKYTDNLFIGRDSDGYASVVILSNRPNKTPLRQKTKLLSVECNVAVIYNLDGKTYKDVVHIIRCLADSEKEIDIFIELAPLFSEASIDANQEDAILETVAILTSFFADNSEPSYTELQGLFAELYTIWSFSEIIDLAKYWQSKDRMKFDFSLSGTDKIEVKSTMKNERRHHFRHEQLLSDAFCIYVVSYMFREDDAGLSLYELIDKTKPLLQVDPRKVLIVDMYIKNTSEDRLRKMRFNEYLIKYNRKVFKAENIPRFEEHTPNGVSNAEYDCVLDNAKDMPEEAFIEELNKIITL
jgi:hypothetical protein